MSDNVRSIWDSGKLPPRPPPPEPPSGADVAWEAAPFIPLGVAGTDLWFIGSPGEVIRINAQRLLQPGLLALLCGREIDWLVKTFPAFDREGRSTGAFSARTAGTAIIARSARVGLFNPETPIRRHGLWKVPGGSALHLGNAVVWNGVERAAGFVEAGALWPRMWACAPPDDPAPASMGVALEALLGRWNWAHEHGAAVMLGLVVNSMLGDTQSWRAHGLVIGGEGTGKSTLLRTVVAGLCPMSIYRNHYTAPGLRQMLSQTAAAIILDEAEGDPGQEMRIAQVIEMLRRASSPGGLQSTMGGADHTSHSFNVTASAILGAILPPPLVPADASRITTLALRPLDRPGDPDELAAFAARHGPALWGRVLANVERVRVLFGILRRMLMNKGCAPRVADQLGIIAASRWAVVREPEADPASDDIEALEEDPLDVVNWLIVGDEDRLQDSGASQALQRLLAAPTDMPAPKLLLGQVLAKYHRAKLDSAPNWTEIDRLDELMQSCGVRWGGLPLKPPRDSPVPPVGLYVSVFNRPWLARTFDGTNWNGQRWGAALAQLPGVVAGRELGAVSIAGSKTRAVWLPASLVTLLTVGD